MGSPEMIGSQESPKDKLIKSGIAKIAIDSLWSNIDILKTLKLNIQDLDFRVAYASDEKDPQITVEIPNVDPATKDRVPKRKYFISDKTVNFTGSLSDEQKQVLTELCEKAGVVVEEPDDLIKERVGIIRDYNDLDKANVSEAERKKIVDAYENQKKRDVEDVEL